MAYDLERFVSAQEHLYHAVLAELRAGRKTGHWMWFVFPQVAGLGQSEVSRFYAIASLAEAQAYLAHPVLGPRLRECAGIVAVARAASAEDMFGPHRRREAPLVDDAVPPRGPGHAGVSPRARPLVRRRAGSRDGRTPRLIRAPVGIR